MCVYIYYTYAHTYICRTHFGPSGAPGYGSSTRDFFSEELIQAQALTAAAWESPDFRRAAEDGGFFCDPSYSRDYG